MSGKKVLIAGAWPYVNGSLHLGHLAALLPGDVLARYHRAAGDAVLFVSGSDCHGTPILVTAEREGRTPEEVAARYHDEFVRVLIGELGFSYSLYSKTMGDFHKRQARELFLQIFKHGHLVEHEEQQAYCERCRRFLPDRYILGTCPHCLAERARGDQCDACGHLLSPEELEKPYCRVCSSEPAWRSSRHLYFDLPQFHAKLREWMVQHPKEWRQNALAQTEGQLALGLHARPVTRDLPWGVSVPVPGFEDKRMYVWFEAVMGYLTCSQEWAAQQGQPEAWREWWENPAALHYYVHGKDNIPFHTIIWAAMLMALGLHLPDRIVSSEYLNFGTEKFSKGEGIGIWLPEVLDQFDPDAVRFFLVLQGPETSDASFQWEEFQSRVNGDLIDNLGNLWNRVFSMAHRWFTSVPEFNVADPASNELRTTGAEAFSKVGTLMERMQFRAALRSILELSSRVNRYIEQRSPWNSFQTNPAHAAETIGVALELADTLRRLVAPVVPHTVERLNQYLGVSDCGWRYAPLPTGTRLERPEPLMKKISLEET